MKMSSFVAAVTALAGLAVSGHAGAAPGSGPAVIRATVSAPAGVPVTASFGAASTYYASKPKPAVTLTTDVVVAPGSYKVSAENVTYGGRLYVATSTRPQLPVSAGETVPVSITYVRNDAVTDLRVSSIGQTTVALTWSTDPKYTIVVRRTVVAPAKAPDQGISVPVAGGVATDSGLVAGTKYTYSLFSQYRDKWVGPMVVRVGTTSANANEATYVAASTTVFLTNAEIVSAIPNGVGLTLTLIPGLAAPQLGAAVILPISASVPGGYLGIVTSLSADGRTIELVAGGLSDAFDFYDLRVANYGDGIDLLPAGAPAAAKSAAPPVPAPQLPLPGSAAAAGVVDRPTPAVAIVPAAASATAKSLFTSCLGGGIAGSVGFSPSLQSAGHFNGSISKYEIPFLPDIPTGASFDTSFAVTVTGAASISTSANVACGLQFGPYSYPISVAPVPIAAVFTPTAQFSLSGGLDVTNVGLSVTAGFQVDGHLGITDGFDFNANKILTATPLVPHVVANGSIGFDIGGQLIIGPGVGTPGAGVVAGVSGELNPVEASFGAVFPINDPRFHACLRASAGGSMGLGVTAKAWLGNWDISQTFSPDALNTDWSYGGPWYYPSGCQNAVTPSDDVLGSGVTKVTDSVTGGQTQWGYIGGLVPNKKAWVLSTGDINSVVGSPSTFASSALGQPGSPSLSALSGRPTYDAVTYTVTLIPTGSTLHIKYAFASEEYPEYVGSQFNDVMAVFVNGTNCATVPGTNTPVSINTVNANTNSQYYIDNAAGAAGYSTTMDGLTVPLQCNRAVTPGTPVTVSIAVADSSDSVYDSAVALLDQGIWSD